MGYINVFVSNPAALSVKNSQLTLKGASGEASYPLEDLNSVLIENLQTTFNGYVLNKIAESGAVLYVCDEKHLPAAIMTPFNTFCRKLKALKYQLNIKKPVEKQIWKNIVVKKILNQAKCLELCGIGNEKLLEISQRVTSGDGTNCEAEAAAVYFKLLYGEAFTRGAEHIVNAALNYGYAILRGIIARTVTAHGLEPCLGIFHCSELNEFNLADDLFEPFRPVVDLYAATMLDREKSDLDTAIKANLFNLINCDVLIKGQKHSVNYAVEIMVSSFADCIKNSDIEITLPDLLPLKTHEYE